MVVLDTFYISYLAYRGSDLLGTSLGTEIVLGAALFYKVRSLVNQSVRPSRFSHVQIAEKLLSLRFSQRHVLRFPPSHMQIKEREKAQAEKENDDGKGGPTGGGGKGSSSAPPLPKALDIKLPDGGLWR